MQNQPAQLTGRGDATPVGVERMRDSKRKRLQGHGFTLIELTITLAIIMTIAALAVPNLVSATQLAKTARAVADVTDIEEEIALYQSIYGVLPDDLSHLGLASYVDPWQNPYQYLNHSTMKGNGKRVRTDFWCR
jgi:prepilin-type N-terminal cleavage/methylation domain-containing protein